jgi:hypothetical protein
MKLAHGQGACSYPGLLFEKAVRWDRSYPGGDGDYQARKASYC